MNRQVKEVADINATLNLSDVEGNFVGLELALISMISDYMMVNNMTLRDVSHLTNIQTRMIHYYLSGNAKDCFLKLLNIANKLGFSGNLTLQVKSKTPAEYTTGECDE
ncbi:hypothetical protein [Acinetobacter sp. P1(2025)]|uniref:hypothetical protein n=1 Tax=Acinetobacter sp. P1(2025) TaxID=3446120 RepID=UPI003F53817B